MAIGRDKLPDLVGLLDGSNISIPLSLRVTPEPNTTSRSHR